LKQELLDPLYKPGFLNFNSYLLLIKKNYLGALPKHVEIKTNISLSSVGVDDEKSLSSSRRLWRQEEEKICMRIALPPTKVRGLLIQKLPRKHHLPNTAN
jgi:hypothetical protein